MVRWVVGSILHGENPLSYFSFQPVLFLSCYSLFKHAYIPQSFTNLPINSFAQSFIHSFFFKLSYFSFQTVFHDWCNKGCGVCYPVCGMMHIKEPLLSIEKSSPCGSSGFPLSLSESYFTICLTPYNRK